MRLMLPLLILLSACTGQEIDYSQVISEIREVKEDYKKTKEKQEATLEPTINEKEIVAPTPEPTVKENLIVAPTPEPNNVILPKTDCNKPKSYIKKNDGFKCMASKYRANSSTVCLLSYVLSRKPFEVITDHHNQTFKASKNKNFNKVEIVLRGGRRIPLTFAGQHNPVYLPGEKIAREHWREENIPWDDIKNKAVRLEAFYDKQKVCLKF